MRAGKARGRRGVSDDGVEQFNRFLIVVAAILADTADAACRRAQALVEGQLGIGLAKPPSARLHYRELRLRDEPAAAAPGVKRDPGAMQWERPADRSQSVVEEDRDERGRT